MFRGDRGRQLLELPGYDEDTESLVNTNAYLGVGGGLRYQYIVQKELKLNLLPVQVGGGPRDVWTPIIPV